MDNVIKSFRDRSVLCLSPSAPIFVKFVNIRLSRERLKLGG